MYTYASCNACSYASPMPGLASSMIMIITIDMHPGVSFEQFQVLGPYKQQYDRTVGLMQTFSLDEGEDGGSAGGAGGIVFVLIQPLSAAS